ncbi:MAG: hypothetical protein L0K44_00995 [Yaniella sp.]|nr:hypothetical protein [Yaniella sp.]
MHPFYVATGMFEGATSPNVLLPILEPNYVADQVFRTLEAGKHQLVLPASASIARWLNILPVPVADRCRDLFGINSTMDHFVGRDEDATA